jgi:hypothetical protein
MSRILRRPMFRGGRVSSYGNGIATGLANGGRVNYANGGTEVIDIQEKISQRMPEKKGLSTGDYLRIASAGMDILGAPSQGGGIKGLLASASGPLSKLGTDLGSSMDERSANRKKEISGLTGAQAEYDIGVMKANKPFETEVNMDVIRKLHDKKVASGKSDGTAYTESEVIMLETKRDREISEIARGGTLASKYKFIQPGIFQQAQEAVADAFEAENGREPTIEELREGVANYLLGIEQSYSKGLAEGGPVGMVSEDVNMMEATPAGMTDINIQETETMQPEEPQAEQLSYDELRARLPKEIGDDIITLLANSYEALADFAEITTQADIDLFNNKYGVQLVLPQEA